MIALPQHRLDALLARNDLVERELATNLGRDDYVKLSREFAELGPVIEAIKAYRTVTAELDPPTGFGDFSNAAQEVAATAAFDALAEPLRAATAAGPTAPVTLRIHLDDGQIMDYDGALHAPRQP